MKPLITLADFDELRRNPPVLPPNGDGPITEEAHEEFNRRADRFWSEQGVEFDCINEWVRQEAIEDVEHMSGVPKEIFVMSTAALPGISLVAMLGMAYEMGFQFGWVLRGKAVARRP